jgi:hypothetical protein
VGRDGENYTGDSISEKQKYFSKRGWTATPSNGMAAICPSGKSAGAGGYGNLKPNLMVSADCQPTSASLKGADDMSDHDKWISYSHWGMFLTGTE